MNLDPLLVWAQKLLRFLDAPSPVPGVSWEEGELKEALGWLFAYRSSVGEWGDLLAMVDATLVYLRKQGYHAGAEEELRATLHPWLAARETPAQRAALRLVAYVGEQSRVVPAGEHWPATSEVLESLLGKAKQLQGQQSRSGFTKMILAIAASVVDLSAATITHALTIIPVRAVQDWLQQKLPASVQAQRQHALPPLRLGTKMA
jgi:hypothetical protein